MSAARVRRAEACLEPDGGNPQRHPAVPIGTVLANPCLGYGGAVNARQTLGREAEQAAADFLSRAGWRLLGRNVRIGRGELDLIARRGRVLAFIEVKARRTATCGAPEDAVDARKRRQVARLAELWLANRPWALTGVDDVRFDIIAVDIAGASPQVRHLPAAFSPGL